MFKSNSAYGSIDSKKQIEKIPSDSTLPEMVRIKIRSEICQIRSRKISKQTGPVPEIQTTDRRKGEKRRLRRRRKNLREFGALSPDTAVLTENCGGGELIAFDIAHKVIIDV